MFKEFFLILIIISFAWIGYLLKNIIILFYKTIKLLIILYIVNEKFINFILLLLLCIIIVLALLLLVAYAVLLERKILAIIQKRRGPNVNGLTGLLQPIADAIKLILKETIVPTGSNRLVFLIAPLMSLGISILNSIILPLDKGVAYSDLKLSILFFFALSGLTVYGTILSGWSSNSRYAFLGSLRAAAQVIAYEVAIGLTVLYIIIQSGGTLNYYQIILSQNQYWNIGPCFILWFLFLICTLAETSRPPFDLPEAEAELVSGYNVEYSAMTFGFFFLGEYLCILVICFMNIILFFGGFWFFFDINSLVTFVLKILGIIILFIWIRGSIPRYRYDQLMRLGWKILFPITLSVFVAQSGKYFQYFLLYMHEIYEMGYPKFEDFLYFLYVMKNGSKEEIEIYLALLYLEIKTEILEWLFEVYVWMIVINNCSAVNWELTQNYWLWWI